SAGLPRFDHRADVTGMGLVALALILGRPLGADEYPHHIPALLDEARERSALGDEQPLSPPLRAWLARALQIDVRRAFASAPEAMAALEELVSDDSMYVAAPVALETFLSRYIASLLEPPTVEPAPAPKPIAATVPVPVPVFASVPEAVNHADEAAAYLDSLINLQLPADQARESASEPLRDITELLRPEPFVAPAAPARVEPVDAKPAPASLFNPDAPFTAPLPAAQRKSSRTFKPSGRMAGVAAVVVMLAGGGAFAYRSYGKTVTAPAMGALVVQSNPLGVLVFVDGIERGKTPARVTLAPGAHILELRGRGVPRVIPLNVSAGAEVTQYLEFAEAPVTGQMAIQSDPSGAKVLVDGVVRGVAPLTITDLAPGDHQVELQSEGASARHTVNVQAGGTASLVVPMGATPGGPVSGWLAVKAPFALEIREGGRLLGTTETDRIMMASGRHELELVSPTLGYHSTRVVQVAPGKIAGITVEVPQGVMNLNASPWAEVWIDGQRVGETPIGNLAVAIGPHEIVFKHPQFGEKKHAVSVTLGAPVRLSVDMK
ncbi:MAG TPA: PEGA domain-containing protein, partial [Vicinamibacterales bacterium]|nr:PEGA domain-containing protein [Vicinamibacterales bacterium]